ncbi:MAG: sulfotransferase [Rhizobiaceae bacterium]
MTATPMHLSGLTDSFGKNAGNEALLSELNEIAALAEEAMLREAPAMPRFPVVFVLGPPRSGTTLLSQLIARCGSFGVIDNFVARFWRAPAFALKVQAALGLGSRSPAGDLYASTRGVTKGWSEPSEFGYFWSRYFDLGQPTHKLGPSERDRFDRRSLCRSVAAMEMVAGRPMAFKNNTWFTFQADLLAELFPGCVLVACHRDAFFVAQSLWLQRMELYGDPTRWWSVRPPDFEDISGQAAATQVARQASSIEREMKRSLSAVRGAVVIDASYRELAAAPRSILGKVMAAAGMDRAEIDSTLHHIPESFELRDLVRLDATVAADIRAALGENDRG